MSGDFCQTISLNGETVAVVATRGGVATLRLPDLRGSEPLKLTAERLEEFARAWRGGIRLLQPPAAEAVRLAPIEIDAGCVEPLLAALQLAERTAREG